MKEKDFTKRKQGGREKSPRPAAMVILAISIISFCLSGQATAKDIYPAGDINYICHTQTGGAFDIMARGMAPYLTKWLRVVSPGAKGGEIKVKNMTGGNGAKASQYMFSDAKPDGYTIGDFNRGNFYRFVLSGEKLPFDVMKFSWLFSLSSDTRVMITNKKSPITSWESMLAFAKKEPLKWAVSSIGASEHIEAIYLKELAKIPAQFTTWGDQASVVGAIIRGDAHVTLINYSAVKSLIDAKEVNLLVSFTEKRLDPRVPTIKEKGYPQTLANIGGPGGSTNIGPPNIDPEAKRILVAAARMMAADPEFLAFAKTVGVDIDPLFEKDFEGLIESNRKFYEQMGPTLKNYLE